MGDKSKPNQTNRIIVFDSEIDNNEITNNGRGEIKHGTFFTRELLIRKLQDLKVYAREVQDFNELAQANKEINQYQTILDGYTKKKKY